MYQCDHKDEQRRVVDEVCRHRRDDRSAPLAHKREHESQRDQRRDQHRSIVVHKREQRRRQQSRKHPVQASTKVLEQRAAEDHLFSERRPKRREQEEQRNPEWS